MIIVKKLGLINEPEKKELGDIYDRNKGKKVKLQI